MTIFTSPYGEIDPPAVTLTQHVFRTLEAQPERRAMIDGPTGREWTAGELTDAIRRFAGGIAGRGLGPGACVALMMPNAPEFAVAMHGALWAGCTVTTLNPTYTAEEAQRQLVDSGASLLVTVAAFAETARAAIAGTGVTEIVTVEPAEDCTPLAEAMGDPLAAQVPVDLHRHVAVLPYSSGTTGLPKGVMLCHANLVANVEQTLAVATIEPGEVTPAFLPFFHIYGMVPVLNGYLARGACLATMPRFDLALCLDLIQRHRARNLWIVPPVAIALAKHPLVADYDLSSLEQITSGAAPLGGEITEAVTARLGCLATQAYGMTEMSPVSHFTPRHAPRKGSVGLALPSTLCRIVDPETGADRAPGEEGELWVKGPQVMLGYHQRPDATAETLVEDGWLRTGDLALIDAEGYCFIRDRRKELIKVKGFAVAPAEIEATLLTHPAIADAAVIGVPDDEAGEAPVAFIVAAPGTTPTLEAVQAHIAEHLAHFKQVREIVPVEAVPKSASGKILRRVLRDQFAARPMSDVA
jgi:4-coumarate--CoA ligase